VDGRHADAPRRRCLFNDPRLVVFRETPPPPRSGCVAVARGCPGAPLKEQLIRTATLSEPYPTPSAAPARGVDLIVAFVPGKLAHRGLILEPILKHCGLSVEMHLVTQSTDAYSAPRHQTLGQKSAYAKIQSRILCVACAAELDEESASRVLDRLQWWRAPRAPPHCSMPATLIFRAPKSSSLRRNPKERARPTFTVATTLK
jgi:hypothetical protein